MNHSLLWLSLHTDSQLKMKTNRKYLTIWLLIYVLIVILNDILVRMQYYILLYTLFPCGLALAVRACSQHQIITMSHKFHYYVTPLRSRQEMQFNSGH